MRDYVVLGKFEEETLRRYLTKTNQPKLKNTARNRFVMTAMSIAIGAAIATLTNGIAPTAVYAATGAAGSVSLGPIVGYIHYITVIIRVIAASMFGLILSYMGLNQVTNIEGNAATATKKYLHGALWGLALVFGGAQLASIFVSHIPMA